MLLEDLLDVDLLSRHVGDGLVSVRDHPTEPLEVLNYTAACQYARAWDDVTRQCRGLVVHQGWGDVVARPWPKFYNYGEHVEDARFENDPPFDLDAPVEVSDKLDGSLGILYPVREGQWAVATRGSFDSEQARVANEIWKEYYAHLAPEPGWTFLFEIVYPENRIVVDYGGMRDLVLLGSVNIETGQVRGPLEAGWIGGRADVFEYATLREALAAEPRENAEGLVVRFLDSGLMVKLKQDDYVELHRIVTGLSERVVWERLGAGETKEQIQEGLPEEFKEWVEDVWVGLQFRADALYLKAQERHEEILHELIDPDSEGIFHYFERRDYAEQVALEDDQSLRPYLFMLLDGKDPRPAIWRSIKPEASSA